MAKYERIIKELEEVRYNYSLSFGKLITNCGAIAIKKPDLSNCIMAFLFITARDASVIYLFDVGGCIFYYFYF